MEVKFYKLNTKKRVDSLKNSGISVMNQKLILNFVNYYFSEGIGEQRALKYLSHLRLLQSPFLLKRIPEHKMRFGQQAILYKAEKQKARGWK